ncbi:helix-turn-helix transcriptional regulator [Phytoactinopolyspora halotolerans]|uniref:WYL domain-containing protein n=1 Tax=Phytoactinopolyspora halotolerans TaxID=1981512 RepID=A0A6L9SGC3_9ACTN|nr:WYL domain-containing protein [Phytoactinopolyspora halotolerans]NEE03140.1 WYL domain-containing protein [Phytoactinopolyspora halotolerans]
MSRPTSRLLYLLSLLQMRRDWPGSVLAERLDVTPRTVRRDVERLREMGYRITAMKGPDGGYRLDAGAELPPMLFDDEQAVALVVALRAASASGIGIDEPAARALASIRHVLPTRLRHRVDTIDVSTIPATGSSPPPAVDPEVLVAVSAATHRREVLRFAYASDTADRPARRVEPHHVVTASGRWYLLAWDLNEDDWRIYRLDRMAPRTPTGPQFAPRDVPGSNPGTYVAARFKGSGHADQWPCVGEATLALPPEQVIPFAGDGVVTAVGHDKCRLRAGSWSWTALATWFGRFDAEITDVAPEELAHAFTTLADRFRRARALHRAE